MSHTNTIQAIRIYLKSEVTENATLGIFTSGGTSEIRISEQTLSGSALTWTHGIIAKGGIGRRGEGGDLSRGGTIADYDGMSVELVNTTQYLLQLKDLGIYLTGCKVELWEFDGTELDSDSVNAAAVFTGIVEDIKADEAVAGIPIKSARYKRNAVICKTVNAVDFPNASDNLIGKTIPATFGKLYPVYDSNGNLTSSSVAKYIRVDDLIDTDMYTNATLTEEATDADIKIFPVYSVVNEMIISLQLNGTPKTVTIGDNVYLRIVSGDGSGQIRQVTGMAILAEPGYSTFYVASPFANDSQPSEANDDTRSWCQIVYIDRKFVCDFWPLRAFLENTTGSETTDKEIYLYEDSLIPVSQYGLEATGTEKNTLQVLAQQYTSDIDQLDSFKIAPIELLNFITEATLADYGFPSIDLSGFNRFKKGAWYGYPGTYLKINGDDDPTEIFDMTADDPEHDPSDPNFTGVLGNNAIDKDADTSIDFDISGTFPDVYDFEYIMGFKGTLPTIPANADVEKIYIGIKMSAEAHLTALSASGLHSRIILMLRRFAHTKTTDSLFEDEYNVSSTTKDYTNSLDNIPSFYADNVSDDDRAFYLETDTSTGTVRTVNGYTLFEITNAYVDVFNAYEEIALLIGRKIVGNDFTYTDEIKIYEIAIIFKLTSAQIKDKVFSGVAARIFNDTWDTRKTAANLMEKPVDMLEHVCRLQDWSETGESGILWGKEYATSALIKTGAGVEGSFDHANLNTLTDQTPALQIDSEAKAQTDNLKKLICRIYELCNYSDADGTECVETMALTNPAETISFGDLAGDVGEIEEPRIEDIFCEPVVNYQMNYGSGEYDRQLRIYNIQNYVKGSNWASCSSGFADQTDAESALDIYYALWLKFYSVEKCPSDFSDTEIITTYADALSYIIRKGNGMGRRRQPSVPVHYDKGKDYHFAKHVQWNHPHQTGGEDVECMIEKITFDKIGNRVDIALLLLEDIPAL